MTPFFVVGVQRSGTTMLRLMLNSHPRLAVPFETGFIKVLALAERIGPLTDRANQRRVAEAVAKEHFTKKAGVLPDIEAVLAYDIKDFGSLIDAIFTAWAKRNGKPRWGVKTPGYVTMMDILTKHFPAAQFIHLVRDGRDVALSYARLSWGTKNLWHAAEDWKHKTILGRKMGTLLGPERYHELRYEDLVREPEEKLRQICEFLDENYDPVMLEYHNDAARQMPRSSIQWHQSSISAPDKNKVFAWKRRMPLSNQILFDEYAGDVLEVFGYERVNHRPTVLSKLKRIYYAAS